MRKPIVIVGESVGSEPPGSRWVTDPIAALAFLPGARALLLVVGGAFDADEAGLLARAARKRNAELVIACVGDKVPDARHFADVPSALAALEGTQAESLEPSLPLTWNHARVREWTERARSSSYESLLGVEPGAPLEPCRTRAAAAERALAALEAWGAASAEQRAAAAELAGTLRDAIDVLATPTAHALWVAGRTPAETG